MLKKKKKFNILKVQQADNLSRFVIDLKKEIREIEEKKIRKFSFRYPKLSFNFSGFKTKLKLFFSPVNQIILVSVLKFFFFFIKHFGRAFYKFCYRLGWLVVYILGLMYFSGRGIVNVSHKIILFFVSFLKYFFINFKKLKKIPHFSLSSAQRDKERGGWYRFLPRPSLKLLRPVFFFLLALILLVLPFKLFAFYKTFNLDDLKEKILGVSEEAVSELKKGAELAGSLNFSEAGENFSKSAQKFLEAQDDLRDVNGFLFTLAGLAPDKDLRLASQSKNILAAGEKASILASNLSSAINSLFSGEEDIMEIMDGFIEYGEKAKVDAQELDIFLDKIDANDLPNEYREEFTQVKKKLIFASAGLNEFVDIVKKLKIFLGANEDKKYLLVFQNNAEMRATGGFIGSFAVIDFSDGKIKNMEAPSDGSYNTEGGLRVNIRAPEPLWLVNPLWHFWDANWWPDWPTSACKLEWFYEKSDGPTVDGVIALTPTVIEDLLKVIGPIDMTKEYGLAINAENFWLETQRLSEQKPDKTKEPKKIIGDLMEKIIKEFPQRLNKETLLPLIKAMEKNLSEKNILFYFNDQELESKIGEYGWDGKIKESSRDYLMVVNTNIAGGKSDKKIKETINHQAEVLADGSIIDTIKIEREHTGVKNEEFVGVRNVNWLRIYVPEGSELIEASGFISPDSSYFEKPDPAWQVDRDVYQSETMAKVDGPSGIKIYKEAGKTVFANWSMVDPGETAVIYLKYKLPFKLVKQKDNGVMGKIEKLLDPQEKEFYIYALLAQKQAGSLKVNINTSLSLPAQANIIWRYPKGVNTTKDGWQISEELNTDKYWAVIFEK